MLHRTCVLRRQCAGWYQSLANNYHHASKGRRISQVLRPRLTRHSPRQSPEWTNLARSLQGATLRCFASMDGGGSESKGNVNLLSKNMAQSGEGTPPVELESYADTRLRQLYLRPKNKDISRAEIYAMSSDIKRIYLQEDTNDIFAFLTFDTIAEAKRNLKRLSQNDDVKVVEMRSTVGREDTKTIQHKLVAHLPNSVPISEEEISALSEDIKKVDILEKESSRAVFLHFDSLEAKARAYKAIKQQRKDFKLHFSYEEPRTDVYLPKLNKGVNNVKDYLMALSDDILDVTYNKYGGAFLTFASRELAMKTIKKLRNEHQLKARLAEFNDSYPDTVYLDLEAGETEELIESLSDGIIDYRIGASGNNRYAHIEMENEKMAVQAIRKIKEKFPDRRVDVARPQNTGYGFRMVRLGKIKPGFKKEQVMELSDYIIEVFIDSSSNEYSSVAVKFNSEARAMEQYKRWAKRGLPCYLPQTREENRKRLLRIDSLSFDVTEKDILMLSKDIIKVTIVEDAGNRHAYLEFESPQATYKNYQNLKGSLGDALFFLADTRDNCLVVKTLKEDDTQDSLRSAFPDAIQVILKQSERTDQRFAVLHFATREASVAAFKTLLDEGRYAHWLLENATDSNARRLRAKFLDPTLTEEELLSLSKDNSMLHVKKDGSIGQIEFASGEAAESFVELADQSLAERLVVFPNTTEGTKLWVTNLDLPEKLEEDVGNPDSTYVDIKEREDGHRYAFVNCTSKEVAEQTKQALKAKGYTVELAKQIEIFPASRSLKLFFPLSSNITEEEVKQMSPDIVQVLPLQDIGTGLLMTKVEFTTGIKCDNNFTALKKLGQEQNFQVHLIGDKHRRYQQELLPRSLNMRFPNLEVTQADIRELSSDVQDVHLYRENGYTYATVVFTTKEAAEANLSEFNNMGLEAKPRRPLWQGKGIIAG